MAEFHSGSRPNFFFDSWGFLARIPSSPFAISLCCTLPPSPPNGVALVRGLRLALGFRARGFES